MISIPYQNENCSIYQHITAHDMNTANKFLAILPKQNGIEKKQKTSNTNWQVPKNLQREHRPWNVASWGWRLQQPRMELPGFFSLFWLFFFLASEKKKSMFTKATRLPHQKEQVRLARSFLRRVPHPQKIMEFHLTSLGARHKGKLEILGSKILWVLEISAVEDLFW